MSGVRFISQRVLVPQGNTDPVGASGLPPLISRGAPESESKEEKEEEKEELEERPISPRKRPRVSLETIAYDDNRDEHSFLYETNASQTTIIPGVPNFHRGNASQGFLLNSGVDRTLNQEGSAEAIYRFSPITSADTVRQALEAESSVPATPSKGDAVANRLQQSRDGGGIRTPLDRELPERRRIIREAERRSARLQEKEKN